MTNVNAIKNLSHLAGKHIDREYKWIGANQKRVLECIKPNMSNADLAKASGVEVSQLGRIKQSLYQKGLISEEYCTPREQKSWFGKTVQKKPTVKKVVLERPQPKVEKKLSSSKLYNALVKTLEQEYPDRKVSVSIVIE